MCIYIETCIAYRYYEKIQVVTYIYCPFHPPSLKTVFQDTPQEKHKPSPLKQNKKTHIHPTKTSINSWWPKINKLSSLVIIIISKHALSGGKKALKTVESPSKFVSLLAGGNVFRYMPPVTPSIWVNTRLADRFGAVCPQKVPDIGNRSEALLQFPRGRLLYLEKLLPLLANQSEDCLYLNLYVPRTGKWPIYT